MKRFLLTTISFLWLSTGWAACEQYEITQPSKVKIDGDSVMIVVHPTSFHDARFSSKRGIDEAVRFAKGKNIPVIYLKDDSPIAYYFIEDCHPDYWVFSAGGEIRFDVTAGQLYIVGGHLELCMSAALHDIIYQWAKRSPRDYKITYLMDGIYSNGKMIDPTDPFYKDFDTFLSIVAYGRPGGEHWFKANLLETMGVIRKEEHELEYIKQILPRWDTTFPDTYQVEIQMNRSVTKILRAADGWHPPTVRFHFVDSALNFSESLSP